MRAYRLSVVDTKMGRDRRNGGRQDADSIEKETEHDKHALTSSTEHVAAGELPHACKQLGETTAEDGHADYGVGGLDATSGDIEHGEDECRGGEREQTTEIKRGD